MRQHVAHLVDGSGRVKPPPLVVVHFSGAWGDPFGKSVLLALAKQPAEFVRRVVIPNIEDPWELTWIIPDLAHAFASATPRPTNIVVPYSIPTAATIKPSREHGHRPFAALFDGRSFASFDGARMRLIEQMLAAGGVCDNPNWRTVETQVICAVCHPHEAASCQAHLDAFNHSAGLCSEERTDDSPGPCGKRSFALAAQSTFCIEPTSDELLRSHTYVAMHSGCIPVLFDGHPTSFSRNWADGASREPTRWAWRENHHVGRLARAGWPDAASFLERVDYSAFAVIYSAHDLWLGKAEGVVRELISLASAAPHAERLRSLREALERATPLVQFAPPGEQCFGAPCDAFSSLALTVHAVCLWHEHAHGLQAEREHLRT